MDIATAIAHTLQNATTHTQGVFGGGHAMSAQEVADFLVEFPVGLISTTDPNGAPHVTGKAVVFVGGKLYFGSREETALGKHMRRDQRVAVAFAEPPWKRHVFIQGEVRFLAVGGEEERRVQDAHRGAHGYESTGLVEVLPSKVFTRKGDG